MSGIASIDGENGWATSAVFRARDFRGRDFRGRDFRARPNGVPRLACRQHDRDPDTNRGEPAYDRSEPYHFASLIED